MVPTTIPVYFTEEAKRRVAATEMHRELDLMLEWVRNNVPDLRAIRLTPGYQTSGISANLVLIYAHRGYDEANPPTDLVEWDWGGWKAQTFPPRVCTNFVMMCTFQPVPAAA